MYYLYIVRCADKTLYTGITKDVKKRVSEHNTSDKGAKYTRVRRPVRLVYTRRFRSRSTASRAEAQIKQLSRTAKLTIIKEAKN
ncbi:MAG: GIY-YIG nuclease family protein [bacterium]|nr:GIY-YIG nuclease family protein [bacterium]